jgi:hypothetical protein
VTRGNKRRFAPHQQQRAESPAAARNSDFVRAGMRLRDVVAYLDRELGNRARLGPPGIASARIRRMTPRW